ncbi:GNAT family N-acyltransferase [Cobetia crustatorum]|uniref:GNAT family N-acyltransferase n=1 Tax=Cobetia crustatorum TaxID=553385 RepID=UPI00046AE89A|nr:lysophospholipid acyltransferase family protein [Cobetia crustatorum]
MIDTARVITAKYPTFAQRHPLIRRPALALLRRLVHESEINAFLAEHSDLRGFDFIDRVLDHFSFGYSVSSREHENIPAYGRVVIVANHPLGSLDGLALLKLVGEVRRDVKIVANDVLMKVEPLAPLLLPLDNLSRRGYRKSSGLICDALMNEEAVIIFPAGEVSRAGPTGPRDGKWLSGFLHFARKTNAPVLPIHVSGRNSTLFYALSSLNRSLGTPLLAHEMFRQRARQLTLRIGELIPLARLDSEILSTNAKTRLLRKHLYRIGRGKRGLFTTEKAIGHPEERQALREELTPCELLGETRDGKKIYLFDAFPGSSVMREIGRLREISFRRVGEGTGQRRDIDRYDAHYRHLVLWDDADLEIAGAYRIGEVKKILAVQGEKGLYSPSLFRFTPELMERMEEGLELGRSFVQPRYWGRRSLDYLWQGLGAYLRCHPEIRWLFGPVTLSSSYPEAARALIVSYYRHYYGDDEGLARARAPVTTLAPDRAADEASHLFEGQDAGGDFRRLRAQLEAMGVTVPTLYKQYAEVTEPGGTRFLDFSVDADFGYCIDGLVMVDVGKITASKRARYIGAPADHAVTESSTRAISALPLGKAVESVCG